MSEIIDDFHQSVLLENQAITLNLIGLDPDLKYFKSMFKNREEFIESIKILHQKCITDGLIKTKHIDQTLRFFKPLDRTRLQCKTVIFNNGRQKSQISTVIQPFSSVTSELNENFPYTVELSEIIETDNISIDDCIAMIADLKLCLVINNWSLTIVLSKTWYNTEYKHNFYYRKMLLIPEKAGSKKLTIHRLKEIKAKLLNSEFTSENFTKEAPYSYADVIKIQMEFNKSKTYFGMHNIKHAIKLLENSLIDTCRTGVQDIYIKIATLLKLPNLIKFQSGEHGIKQLTSRVVTLDHDILHRDLIPNFHNYVISEKVDGITSSVLIVNKEMFVTCGSIVYKFDIIQLPNLPPTRDIEALGLNKIDFNNIWIFDAEVIPNPDGIIILMPFDIRMANSINIDNINFKYRLMFMSGIRDLRCNKVEIKMKKWHHAKDIKALYSQKIDREGFIFAYLESLNFTTSMYYANKIWKWKPNILHNTIDFLIQKCPDTLKGKSPYIAGGKHIYVLCCGISKSIHQTLPNIKVEQSIIPNNANDYFPALFSPSDKPYEHIYWSDQANLHGEIGEFIYENTWKLMRLRTDRKIEVERGNYFGNDHRTAENNWFTINNPLTIHDITLSKNYVNSYSNKHKFINAIYENLVRYVLVKSETILNISPVTVFDCFDKFTSVIYAFNNIIDSNRYVKDKYELAKKRIRFNSYYVQYDNISQISEKLKSSTIPISKNGVDNLLLVYSINQEDKTPGFNSVMQGSETIKIYEELINRNGKIIIVINDAPGSNNFKINTIEETFIRCKYKKIMDTPISKWVYIPDSDLYDHSRILVFSRNKKDCLIE